MSQNLGAPALIQDTFHRKNYRTGRVLGKGGFAVVYEVTDDYSQEKFACKLTPKQKLSKKKFFEKFTSEVKIHRQLNHPYIVRVNNVFKDTINYYMLMELCDQGNLSELVRRRQRGLSEEEVQRIAYELCQAYTYMKEYRVVHRDMKSANVFMTELPCPEVAESARAVCCKVGDFGLSVQLEGNDERHFTLCGTPNFLPPETIVSHVYKRLRINRECDQNIDLECQELCKQLTQRLSLGAQGRTNYAPIDQGHSYPSDMWSLGCILYSLFFTRPPFESSNIQNTYKKIVRGDFQFPSRPNVVISDAAKNFIECCLRVDPNDRLTIEQALKHDWLGEGKTVRLKALPFEITEAGFNPDGFRTDPALGLYCNYSCSIAEYIQRFKDGTIHIEPQVPKQDTKADQHLVARQAQNVEEQPNDIQSFLTKRFARYEFVTNVLSPPNPLRYVPVLQYLDVKGVSLSHESVEAFQRDLGEVKQTVFNEYDWWCKIIRDNARDAPINLINIHQHVYTLSWIDFSNRYGFSYQLSNGCVGVLFNDMSIVVMSPNMKYVDYIDLIQYKDYQRNAVQIQQNEEQIVYPEKQQIMLRIKFPNVKDFLNEKKYKLVMYFKEYLENRSISPLVMERKDSSDLFVYKNFDFIYDESCFLYAAGVTEEQVLRAYDQRQKARQKWTQTGQLQPIATQPSFAIKMVECKLHEPLISALLKNYVQELHSAYGQNCMYTQQEIVTSLEQKFTSILRFPQTYIKRYHLNELVGTLCILYNSKVFQVNFPDHIKIVIAHKTVSILNAKREILIYPSSYLKHLDFRFDELRLRIQESRRLYELVRRARFE